MIFNKPRVNVIACDEGFSVQVLGLVSGVTYTEGPRCTVIESEPLTGPSQIGINGDRPHRWEPPHDNESLSMAHWLRILHNVRRAFQWDGYEIAIQWPALYDHVIPFDPEQGYPAGDALFYECLNCGTIIPSLPPDSTTCYCRNISIDVGYGRLSIKEHAVARLLAVDQGPATRD